MARRARKAFLRTVLGICVLAALALLIVSAILPVLARQRVERVLSDLGVSQSSFSVTSASLNGIRLEDVRLGEAGWLSAGNLNVDYSAASLWKSRVKFITVERAVYRIGFRDEGVDFGFDPQPGAGSADLPLSSITLRDCVIVLDFPAGAIRLGVDGVVMRHAPGVLTAHLDVHSVGPISFQDGQFEIVKLRSTLPLRIAMTMDQLQLSALDGESIELSIEAFTMGSMGAPRTSTRVVEINQQPLLRLVWGEGQRGLWMNAALHTSAAKFNSDAFAISADEVAVRASYAAPQFEVPHAMGLVQISNGLVKLGGASLELRGVSLTAPVTINGPTPEREAFNIESVVWRDRALPGLSGTLAISDARVDASARWTPFEGAVVDADANLSVSNSALQGEIAAHLPRFTWQDDSALGSLFPNLGNLDAGGELSADAQLSMVDGALQPRVEVRAHQASFTGADWPATIDSFSGSVVFNNFHPLTSEPDQRIEIHRATVGETPIVDGTITFALDGVNRIAIREASWSMQELGRFQASSFVLDATAPRIETDIRCQQVGLAAWLKLLTEDRIHGEGELSGELKLAIQPLAREKFSIMEGYLFAQPAGGWIKTDDSEAISRIVETGTASLSGDERLEQVRDRVVAALQDYQYTMLRLHFIPEDQGLLCTLMTKGRGRKGPDAQEIESLTINLHGFDEAIRAALAGKSLWDMTD